MAANHSDSCPCLKIIQNNGDRDKNNMLKSSACPTCKGPLNSTFVNFGDTKLTSNSDAHEVSFITVNLSDIDSDTCDTLNSSDVQFNSDSSILNTTFNSVLNEAHGLDHDFHSVSDNEYDKKTKEDDVSSHELDTVSLSSSATTQTSVVNTNNITSQYCAVMLCNENARKQFDRLFFINFPHDAELCDTWWKICGRKDKFDPSFKICSIHFDSNDFKSVTVRKNDQLFRQTILKNNEIVPTHYLLPQEYLKFIRKRKMCNKDNINSTMKKKSETKRCIIKNCNKTFSKDSRSTLFFKFPMENKLLLKKWLDKIGLPSWQPLESDRICSDHFENYYVMKYNNVYELDTYAVPSIKPKNPFLIKSEVSYNKKHEDSEQYSSNLEFHRIDDNVLFVNEKKKNSIENEKSILLDSLKNSKDNDNQIKSLKKIPETVTSLLKSTEEAKVLSSFTKYNNSSLEYLDNLDDLNNIEELQLKLENSTSLTKQYLESFEKEIAKDIETNVNSSYNNNDSEYNMYLDLFSNENMVEALPISNTNDGLAKTSLVPKTKDNENDHSCVNLNTLNGDDIDEFLSFKKNCIPKASNNKTDMTKIESKSREYDVKNTSDDTSLNNVSPIISSNLSKKWHIELTDDVINDNPADNPVSIIYDQDLTECYGEMLPPCCDPHCQLICYHSIPGPQRREIYDEFLMLQNVTVQNCKIVELVEFRLVKSGETTESCVSYRLMMDKTSVKVCRKFFKNTLGVTEHRLDAILKPINYSWYSDRETALKVNAPKPVTVSDESVVMTDFILESLTPLNIDYNLFEPEGDTVVSLENVSVDEYERAMLFMKSIPRVLSSFRTPVGMVKHRFETSICVETMYKSYSEKYFDEKTPPPFTLLQFKKIYNQCMKTLLRLV